MGLEEKINGDMRAAMKSRDKATTGVLRMLLSEIKYLKSAGARQEGPIPDKDVLACVAAYHKKLNKSLKDYPDGEARSRIQAEMAIVEGYLPARATEEEIRAAVSELLASTEERNFGALMKEMMARFAGTADGKIISQILKQAL